MSKFLTLLIASATMAAASAQSPAPEPRKSEARSPSQTAEPRPQAPARPLYFLGGQADWSALLPPPPSEPPLQQRELQAVLDAQAAASKNAALMEHATGDAELTCFRFADVLGPAMNKEKLPALAAFLDKAASEGGDAADPVKKYWKRPRPYMSSAKVQRLADVDPDYEKKRKEKEEAERAKQQAAGNAPRPAAGRPPFEEADAQLSPEEREKRQKERQKERDHSSYPSGHATFGTLCGLLLAQMVPEKRGELFARADAYRQARLVVGAHYPSDIESGRVLATAVAAFMQQSFAYQRDFNAARLELRAALGLPALPPAPPQEKKSD